MAKRIRRQLINELTEVWEPQMKRAFRQSINQVTSNARLADIARALERGDVERALEFVGLDARDFRSLGLTIESAFEAGGFATARAIQGAAPRSLQMIVRFDARSPRAEQWLLTRSSSLITQIVNDQRLMIRSALSAGMEAGSNPRTVALDLIGRINKQGVRQGGVIGLNSGMEEAARRYASDIVSGDPERMKRATRLKLRDKRFDRTVAKAIREGRPIPKKMLNTMARQYRNKALKNRGDTIARTEMLEALSTANHEAYQQAVDEGVLAESAIKRFAITAGDERVRHSHRLIPGMNSEGVALNEPFKTPDGPRDNTPFDIQCRCFVETRVDFLAGIS